MIETKHAILSLRPNTEWTMSDNNLDTLVFHTEGVTPLTTDEVEAEMRRLQQAQADKEAADAAARDAAIAHAKSLGFTDQMIAVMYPNLAN